VHMNLWPENKIGSDHSISLGIGGSIMLGGS